MISTHAPDADQIGAGALKRPKSSLYGWLENGEGLTTYRSRVSLCIEAPGVQGLADPVKGQDVGARSAGWS